MVDIIFETKPGIVDEPENENKNIPHPIVNKDEEINKNDKGRILMRDKVVVIDGLNKARKIISNEINKSNSLPKADGGQKRRIGLGTMALRAGPAMFGAIYNFARFGYRFVKGYVPEAVGGRTKINSPRPPSATPVK